MKTKTTFFRPCRYGSLFLETVACGRDGNTNMFGRRRARVKALYAPREDHTLMCFPINGECIAVFV